VRKKKSDKILNQIKSGFNTGIRTGNNKQRDPSQFLYWFKKNHSLEIILKYFTQVLFFPNLQNSRINNLIVRETEDVHVSSFYHPSLDIARELVWTTLVLNKYSKSLNEFNDLRIEFENNILLNRYKDANLLLNVIENKFGISLWLIKNKLNLLQNLQGLEAQKNYANKLLDMNISTELKILIHLLSISAETNISPGHFNKIIDNFFEEFSNEGLKEYFKYKLKKDYPLKSQYLSTVLVEENRLTLIDIYETYIDILNTVICKNLIKDEIPDKLAKVLRKLYSTVKDHRLLNILRTLNISIRPTYLESSESIIKIYDEILNENNKEVKQICEKILQKNPVYLSLYEIYIESLNSLGEDIQFSDNTLIHTILTCYKNILLANDSTHDSIITLFRIMITYSNLSFSNEILTFVLGYMSDETTYKKLFGYINIPIFSYLKQEIYGHQSKQAYIENLLAVYPSSKTLQVLSSFDQEEKIFLDTVKSLKISTENYNNFLSQYYLLNDDFSKGFIYANKLLNSKNNIVKNQAKSLVLSSRLKENKISEATTILINFYLENDNLSYRLPIIGTVDEVINLIEKTSIWPTDIETTILFYLCVIYRNHDTRSRTEFLYEHYLSSSGYKKPIELIIDHERNNKAFDIKIIFFLKEVCVPDIMKKSIYFSDYNDAERERIDICHYLKDIDEKNAPTYLEEIKDREQKLFIRKESSRIDKNKIYVDISGIKVIFDKEVKDDYDRLLKLLEMGKYEKNSKIETIINVLKNISQDTKMETRETLHNTHMLNVPNNEVDDLCKKIIELSKDIFVKNEHYGLDVYLSTKIRHGTISNHLRKPLERANLVTLKDSKTNEYQNNIFWEDELHNIDEKKRKIIQDNLKRFSKKHDEIIKYLSAELLQVSTSSIRKTLEGKIIQNDNKNALFKYYFSDLELKEILYKIIDEKLDFPNFKNYLIMVLWEKTDVNLTAIRRVLEHDITLRINNNFDDIEQELQKITNISSLKNAIAKSRTEMNQSLTTLIAWFGRMEVSERKDYNIKDAITIVANIFKKQDDYLTINITKSINLQGKTLDSFIDILFILFDNAFKHSNLNEQTRIIIEIKQDNNYIYINMKNNISVNANLLELNTHIDSIFKQYGTKQATAQINKEGKTGFNKIWKLLVTDLETQEHSLNANFVEDKKEKFFEVNLKINAQELLV